MIGALLTLAMALYAWCAGMERGNMKREGDNDE